MSTLPRCPVGWKAWLVPSPEVGVQHSYFRSSQLTLRGGLAENPFTVAHVLSGPNSAWPGEDGVCREHAHSHFSLRRAALHSCARFLSVSASGGPCSGLRSSFLTTVLCQSLPTLAAFGGRRSLRLKGTDTLRTRQTWSAALSRRSSVLPGRIPVVPVVAALA